MQTALARQVKRIENKRTVTMDIEELLDKYFDGATSCDEEQRLRAFFAAPGVPPHLVPYRALFGYFDREIARSAVVRRRKSFRWKLLAGVWAVAASVLLLVGLYGWRKASDPCSCSENYVVIDGRCYTDARKVKQCAREALLQLVASDGEWADGLAAGDPEFVENELNRLGDIFGRSDQ